MAWRKDGPKETINITKKANKINKTCKAEKNRAKPSIIGFYTFFDSSSQFIASSMILLSRNLVD